MEIQLQELQPCVLKVDYEANLDEILLKKEEVIKTFSKAPVPGFRKGKASLQAVEVHYKNQIDDALKRALAEEAYYNTLFEKNIKPHGLPQVNSVLLTKDKFNCTFTLFKRPEFTLGQYKELEIVKLPDDSRESDALLQKMVEELRQMVGDKKIFEENDFVQTGDNIVLNFKGYMDGVQQTNLSAEGQVLKVGTNFIADFEDNIYGMKVGEAKKFSIVASEKALPTYAGKQIDFEVELVSGQKTIPVPLDDEMAKRINRNSLDQLMSELTASASAQIANSKREQVIHNISAKLLENNEVEVPSFLISQECKYLAAMANVNWDTLSDTDKEFYASRAHASVKLSLILEAIRENEAAAQVSDEEAIDAIKKTFTGLVTEEEKNAEILNLAKNNKLQNMVSTMRDQNTFDFIYQHCKFVE